MGGGEPESFGALLREYRLAAGLAQEALAARAGLSARAVSDLERGARRAPYPDTVRRLAAALGLSDAARAHLAAAGRRHHDPAAAGAPSPRPPLGEASAGALPGGTVTLLFTDIEGSTRLLQRLGERYAGVLAEHQRLLRAAFAAHGGREVDTQGDAFFVAFPRAIDAVRAAVAAQRALAAHPWPEGAAVRVRMGLHTGEPTPTGGRYVGLDVHRAARVGAAAHGGQVLLTQTTEALVAHELPDAVRLRALGPQRLKDLQHPEPLYQLVVAGLPADFPPLQTLDRHAHNLPVQPTPLLGREREVGMARALLARPGARLVTLTGPGGVGKTRLGLQVAAEVADRFPDGVWLVPLAPLGDPALVGPTVARTLGLGEAAGQPLRDTLAAYLRDKRLLLLLDNVEHLLDAAPLLADLLAASPALAVLATSRAPLRLAGEREVAVPPLPLPAAGRPPAREELGECAAVRLFVDRAQAVRADFRLTDENAAAVAEICRRLDGLPLALALAAARARLFAPPALLARLARPLALLTGGARDLPARQQTLRATIDWSYGLLGAGEQRLFARLAVFAGGCTLEAAEAVCDGAGDLGADVLEGLEALVAQSLLRWEPGAGDEARVAMLETLREYAAERLAASGEAAAAGRAHAAHYLALAEAAERELAGPRQAAALARLEAEHDNLRAALAGSAAGTGRRAAGVPAREGAHRARRDRAQPGRPAGGRLLERERGLVPGSGLHLGPRPVARLPGLGGGAPGRLCPGEGAD
jgi:predicted ATPase/class 3 adenylate cyclase